MGESAIEEILKERLEHGSFAGLYDLCKRVDLRKVNRRVLEALCRAGAFDVFDPNRAAHLAELPTIVRVGEQHGKMAETGQDDLFGLTAASETEVADNAETYTTSAEPWTEQERLAGEKQTLGLYLTGHPIAQYEAEIRQFSNGTIAHLLSEVERSKGRMEACVAGLVVEIRTRQTKQGKTMGFATIDDRTGRLEIAAFGDKYETYRSIFSKDTLLVAEGGLAIDDFSGNLRLNVETLYNIDQAREQFAKSIQINWVANGQQPESDTFITDLQNALLPFKGGSCPISISYTSTKAMTEIQLGDNWRVHPTDELLARLKKLPTVTSIEIKYR